jgi:DNA-binding NarL/FixJ family response regulator
MCPFLGFSSYGCPASKLTRTIAGFGLDPSVFLHSKWFIAAQNRPVCEEIHFTLKRQHTLMTRKTVLIAEDHPLVVEGIASVLRAEFEILGIASNGRDLIAKAEHLRPDFITMDIGMPELNGIEAASALKKSCPDTLLVCVTQHNDVEYLLAAIRAGIVGFVSKQDASGELVEAIRTVSQGRLYITHSLRNAYDKLARENPGKLKATGSPLTPRQREVLQLLAEGRSTKEIASALNISLKTVEFHRGSIADVLGLHSVAELTRYALEHRITSR